jgi:hypothetical protein
VSRFSNPHGYVASFKPPAERKERQKHKNKHLIAFHRYAKRTYDYLSMWIEAPKYYREERQKKQKRRLPIYLHGQPRFKGER